MIFLITQKKTRSVKDACFPLHCPSLMYVNRSDYSVYIRTTAVSGGFGLRLRSVRCVVYSEETEIYISENKVIRKDIFSFDCEVS